MPNNPLFMVLFKLLRRDPVLSVIFIRNRQSTPLSITPYDVRGYYAQAPYQKGTVRNGTVALPPKMYLETMRLMQRLPPWIWVGEHPLYDPGTYDVARAVMSLAQMGPKALDKMAKMLEESLNPKEVDLIHSVVRTARRDARERGLDALADEADGPWLRTIDSLAVSYRYPLTSNEILSKGVGSAFVSVWDDMNRLLGFEAHPGQAIFRDFGTGRHGYASIRRARNLQNDRKFATFCFLESTGRLINFTMFQQRRQGMIFWGHRGSRDSRFPVVLDVTETRNTTRFLLNERLSGAVNVVFGVGLRLQEVQKMVSVFPTSGDGVGINQRILVPVAILSSSDTELFENTRPFALPIGEPSVDILPGFIRMLSRDPTGWGELNDGGHRRLVELLNLLRDWDARCWKPIETWLQRRFKRGTEIPILPPFEVLSRGQAKCINRLHVPFSTIQALVGTAEFANLSQLPGRKVIFHQAIVDFQPHVYAEIPSAYGGKYFDPTGVQFSRFGALSRWRVFEFANGPPNENVTRLLLGNWRC